MADTLLKGIIISVLTAVVHCESCYNSNGKLLTCSTGCCGETYYRYCCSSDVGAIVGLIVGCIFGVALIVGTIIAVYCCCRKQRGRQGQVLGGAQATTTTTTVVGGGAYPMTSYTTATAHPYGQPAMGHTNVAYPQMQINTGYPQMPQAGMDQKWQQPPPSYDTANPR